jgi:hypothetical protein
MSMIPTGRNTALAAQEQRVADACPGWQTWVIQTYDRRLLWSAQPDGALGAVIDGEPSADDLIGAVQAYHGKLPAHLEDARRQLASVPATSIGRDKARVLQALVASLEQLQAAQLARAEADAC